MIALTVLVALVAVVVGSFVVAAVARRRVRQLATWPHWWAHLNDPPSHITVKPR
jgi:hypothetical protein